MLKVRVIPCLDVKDGRVVAVAERGSGVEGTEGEVTAREPAVRKLQLSDFADLRIRVRVQPRIDAGDLVPSEDGRSYDLGHDTYLRRIRLSFTGDVLHALHYVVTLDGDRVSQAGRPNQVHVTDAALEWRPDEAFQLRFGRAKLPITRIGLTSSARQLLVDRPISIDAARGFLGDVNQANLLLHGRLGGGVLAWYAAAADGWNAQDALYGSSPGERVRTSTPAGVLRAELAPPGFTTGEAERAALWHLRKGLAARTGAMRPTGTAFLTEDVAVPVARLAEAILDFQLLFARHGVPETVVFGHAKDGNLHFVLAEDVRSPEAIERYGAFMQGLVDLVVNKYDGAIKAEHGSGRNMAPFVKTEWGERAYSAMERVKRMLDPDGILNPGVLLNPNPRVHLENLKPCPTISPLADRTHMLLIASGRLRYSGSALISTCQVRPYLLKSLT